MLVITCRVCVCVCVCVCAGVLGGEAEALSVLPATAVSAVAAEL